MRSAVLVVGFVACTGSAFGRPLRAQDMDAPRHRSGDVRMPTILLDPFRDAFTQRVGVSVTASGFGRNSAFNAADVRALAYLADQDLLEAGDVLDALGILPAGEGFELFGGAAGGAALNLQISRLTLSLSGKARGDAFLGLGDEMVSVLRDGNGDGREISLTRSGATVLATGEAGAHALLRLGPLFGPRGPDLVLGAGLRSIVRPLVYGKGFSTRSDGGRLAVTPDSIIANVGVELQSALFDEIDGSGTAFDMVLRAEWPRPKVALELMVANVGSVALGGVERRTAQFDIAVASLDTLQTILENERTGPPGIGDTLALVLRDTVTAEVTLPRIVRMSADYTLHRLLQVHGAVTTTNGEWARPRMTEVGLTLRPIWALPLRAGLLLGDGVGVTGGLGIETRHLLLRVQAASLGGFASETMGVGAAVQLGLFF